MTKKILLVLAVVALFSSCNLLSVRNVSNDFKWRNKKFDSPIGMEFLYQPEIVFNQSKNPLFYTVTDSSAIDSIYNIKKLLLKKFAKRNLIQHEKNTIKLTVEKLKFEEYSESISVNDNEGNFINMDYKIFFIFEIEGTIVKDTSVRNVSVRFQHTVEPRESFLIPGHIVNDGIGASTERMLENAVNQFTYRAFEEIKRLE